MKLISFERFATFADWWNLLICTLRQSTSIDRDRECLIWIAQIRRDSRVLRPCAQWFYINVARGPPQHQKAKDNG